MHTTQVEVSTWLQVVVEWQPRGLAQMVADFQRPGTHAVVAQGRTQGARSQLPSDASPADVSHVDIKRTAGAPMVHSNPTFRDTLGASMSVYPSAGAAII